MVVSKPNTFPGNANPNTSSSSSSSSNLQEISNGSFVDSVFWSLPTLIEVQNAIAALQSFMQGVYPSPTGSAPGQLQPMLSHGGVGVNATILRSPGFQRLYDAFRLLQTVPSFQRMLISIATDKAVWNAVLNNSQVLKFKQILKKAVSIVEDPNKEETDVVSMTLRWILDNLKLKLMDLVHELKLLFDKTFGKVNINPQFEEHFSSALLLSVVCFMLVLVTRAFG